jgi:UDP-N-acetylmuramoylalanine--D-glutamate ligase
MSRWEGKQVVMIGAARQGLALSRHLAEHGASVVLTDNRPDEALEAAREALSGLDITWVTGGHPLSVLDNADLVCLSGGVPLDLPLVQEAEKRGIPLSNDSQIFLEEAPCPVIGITGSAGKSTTTALVGEIAKRHYELRYPENTAWVGGNLGNPLIQYVDEMKADDIAVMELSSFQLEIMTASPQIAAILNLTPNHLDRHETMSKYISAKAHILTHQKPDDIAILNRDDFRVRKLYTEVKGRRITFGLNPPYNHEDSTYYKRCKLYLQASGQVAKIIKSDLINLPGTHNLYNILAAIAISAAARFSLQAIYDGIVGFNGIPHRLEFVREWGGADWYNDSIATAPERAMAAINAFDRPIVLLAGGRDKDLPWQDFASLAHEKVDHLVLFGETVDLIAGAVGEPAPGTRPYTIDRCKTLEEAVRTAAERVEPGDVVLLSPGGTSYDEFVDFEERGKRFTQWVKELT